MLQRLNNFDLNIELINRKQKLLQKSATELFRYLLIYYKLQPVLKYLGQMENQPLA